MRAETSKARKEKAKKLLREGLSFKIIHERLGLAYTTIKNLEREMQNVSP